MEVVRESSSRALTFYELAILEGEPVPDIQLTNNETFIAPDDASYTVFGSAGAEHIGLKGGDDRVDAGAGDDLQIETGAGEDIVVFKLNHDTDQVLDFDPTLDRVEMGPGISAWDVSVREEILADHTRVVLEIGTDTLYLKGTSLSDLASVDWIVFDDGSKLGDPAPIAPLDPVLANNLVQNTDSRLDHSAMNVITGTDGRDDIVGTGGDDYIIAGAGKDFFVRSGVGNDTFEVNLGDDVVRIADFKVGSDVIALESKAVLDAATITQGAGRLDVRLSDGTLIRVENLRIEDVPQAFIFRNVPPEDLILPEAPQMPETPQIPEMPQAPSHPEGLVTNTDARLDKTAFNLIEGTDMRDKIIGSDGDDYIVAGGGKDFYVRGGGGSDTFEVNVGDDVVRIADFELGKDVIALESQSVLDDATLKQGNGRLDVRLSDGTLLRIEDLLLEDAADAFVFRNVTQEDLIVPPGTPQVPNIPQAPENPNEAEPPEGGMQQSENPPQTPPTEPQAPEVPEGPAQNVLKIVIWGGQSLAVGAGGREWVNTSSQFANSLMLDYDDPKNGSRGWEGREVALNSFRGFTERVETDQETPATGGMNLLAQNNPDITFLSLHYGKGGTAISEVRQDHFPDLVAQLELIKAEADRLGYTIDPRIEVAWIQGQSDASNSAYEADLRAHQDELEVAVKDTFGLDFDARLFTSITKGYGAKDATRGQFDAIMNDEDIEFGASEVVFNVTHADQDDITDPHLDGDGYYLMGTQIGAKIDSAMNGNVVAPIAIADVREVADATYHVDFSGVQGNLAEDPTLFAQELGFLAAPDHFGMDVYKTTQFSESGEIVSSRIVDNDTIEFVYSKDLEGSFVLWIGRSDQDDWIDTSILANGGKGYGGTTLYDTGQSYTAVAPGSGLSLAMETFNEFVPQQAFEFMV
ncbi:MAG: hypothetical protein AAGD04_10110 [Pseudomonadota bacterium]